MNSQSLAVNGLRIEYMVEGHGPDIVLIHGWAASRRMWSHLTAELAANFRCWSMDLPGCGDSEKPDQLWYSIPNFTAMLSEFFKLQGLGPVLLVGHSMGGMIALNLGARHASSVARLVAISPVVTGRARLRHLASPRLTDKILGWMLRLSPAMLQPLLAHPLGAHINGMQYIRRRTEDFAKGTRESLLCSGRAIINYDVSPLLGRITAPTLVLVGSQDLNVPMSEARLAAARIPGASLHIMRAGHLPTDDRPAEVIGELSRFFA